MPLIEHITRPLLPGKMYHIYNRGNEKHTLICFNEGNYRYFLRKYAEYMSDYMDTFAYCILPDHYHLAVRIKPEDEVLSAAVRDIKMIRPDASRRMKLSGKMRELRWWLDLGEGAARGEVDAVEGIEAEVAGGGEVAEGVEGIEGEVAKAEVAEGVEGIEVCQTSEVWQTFLDALDALDALDDLPFPSATLGKLRTHVASWAISERYRRFLLGYTHAINKQQNRRGSLMQKPFRRKLFESIADMKRLIRYIHRNPIHHNLAAKIKDYIWNSYHAYKGNQKTRIKRDEALQWFGGPEEFLKFHETNKNDNGHYGEP